MENDKEEYISYKKDIFVKDKIENVESSNNSISTPTQSKNFSANTKYAFSPIFSQCSLEDNEEIDVMWDWHSPQSKRRTYRQKRVNPQHSPKIPVKRQPSNNQFSNFEKITEDIKLIRDQIVENTDLSSRIKKQTNLDEVFNDSMEEELFVCSQKIEEGLAILQVPANCNSVQQLACRASHDIEISGNNNITSNFNEKSEIKIADDSFDFALRTLNDTDLEFSNKALQGSKNEEPSDSKNQKIENANVENFAKQTLDEIERKKRQAFENRQIKMQQQPVSPESDSPIKCSPEEIEQKRLKAVAKRDAKIIERNRLEALKRREINKKRRALQFETTARKLNLKRTS